jgi:hypothetical protein
MVSVTLFCLAFITGGTAASMESGPGPYASAEALGALRATGLLVPEPPPVSVIVAGWPLCELEDLFNGFENFAPPGSKVKQ